MIADLLGKQIFLSMPMGRFANCYKNNLQDPERERVIRTAHDSGSSYFFLSGGYVCVENEKGQWSLFETKERTHHREHLEAWARFARGCWTMSAPTSPGCYPTKDRFGKRQKDRNLIAVGNGVKDVSGGFVASGKVSEWVGFWWTEAMPPLPDSI